MYYYYYFFASLSRFSVWKMFNFSEKLLLLVNYVHLQVFTS